MDVAKFVALSRLPFVGFLFTFILQIFGVSIPPSVVVGKRLMLPHGAVGLVVHEDTVIGDDVKIYQGVTIGRSDTYLPSGAAKSGGRIVVGSGAVIGAGACVLFKSGSTVRVGAGAVIGANSVVLRDVPDGEIWAGNPAKFVRTRTSGRD